MVWNAAEEVGKAVTCWPASSHDYAVHVRSSLHELSHCRSEHSDTMTSTLISSVVMLPEQSSISWPPSYGDDSPYANAA